MPGRHLIFVTVLAAAIGLPVMWSQFNGPNGLWLGNSGVEPGSATAMPPADFGNSYESNPSFDYANSLSHSKTIPVGVRLPSAALTNQPADLSPQNISTNEISTVPVLTPGLAANSNPSRAELDMISSAGTIPPASLSPGPFEGFGLPDGSRTVILPGNAMGPDMTAMPLEFMPIANLGEIIRFDVEPNWVKSRWSRVSTIPEEEQLHGLRVPLVTGVNSFDLYGSLTYYFDANQDLQRITFLGWTGDATRLVNLLTTSYDFKSQPAPSAGLYVLKYRRQLKGALLLENPTVIRSENVAEQIAILLEINRTDGPHRLSYEIESMISPNQ
jgi:hypothetical protein